jgi:hypothetical protein
VHMTRHRYDGHANGYIEGGARGAIATIKSLRSPVGAVLESSLSKMVVRGIQGMI